MDKIINYVKALSDETRLRIINLLYIGELCVCKIVETLNLPQSTVSRHLNILKNAGIVENKKQGKWNHYKLTITDKDFIKDIIMDYLTNDEICKNDVLNLEKVL